MQFKATACDTYIGLGGYQNEALPKAVISSGGGIGSEELKQRQ